MDDTKGQGEPHFGTHYIEVGGGQSSGGLGVETIAPQGQSCGWGVKVYYLDAYQKGQWGQLKDESGEPPCARTESVSLDPRRKRIEPASRWRPNTGAASAPAAPLSWRCTPSPGMHVTDASR